MAQTSFSSTPSPKTALVTGASGYIGLHIVNTLLEEGWTVHGTVRSLRDERKVQPLRDVAEKYHAQDRMRLFEADLLTPDSFLEAMKSCDVVFHVASPFFAPEKVRDPQKQLVEPALEGTRNVLNCVEKTECVRRVVLTSSGWYTQASSRNMSRSLLTSDRVAATFGDNADVLQYPNQTLTEDNWNTTSTLQHNPYQYSKTLAEKEAWKLASAQCRWDLVVICPGLVLGPSLTPASSSGSLDLLDQVLRGLMVVGAPDLSFAIVDVRDVALAHVRAATVPEAHGRYIVADGKLTSVLEVARCLKKVAKWPQLLPSWVLPHFVFRMVAPLMGLSMRWADLNQGVVFRVDNERATRELGINYRPVETTLEEHYRAWAGEI
ncbi:uncharacterized protein CTHT_0049530 [Thermochaetoides thermophila DSM 1495]|uniref:NAD-dependent epimerase/dehydratase domain-containing protein n=1 Tax=Chaetomium thermophilum (strain DSM 1495 / CBS 144.50 / IMI 039719) TaxID=759272 RepID=G0SBA6_CHATD|nr:hypothetical protein CTHT_0049530 [Thermochaetoides thermophila DSM 1495]EGS19486.1 hypothetical protein CTHT_0049530 [Thermochaetoides thermophila DSM 1495]